MIPTQSKPKPKPAPRQGRPKPAAPAPVLAANNDFTPISTDFRAQLILDVSGHARSGKNHLCFTAPGDFCVHCFDLNIEAVARKFALKGVDIKTCKYVLPTRNAMVYEFDQTMQDEAMRVWDRFVPNLLRSLDEFRNVIVDTQGDCWELLRMKHFGKLSGPAHLYTPVNGSWKELVREGLNHNANVFWLSKLQEIYKTIKLGDGKTEREPTGTFKRVGFSGMDYLVQAELRTYSEPRDGGGVTHHVKCLTSTFNPDLEGYDWSEDTGCSFLDIAQMMIPEVPEEAWK